METNERQTRIDQIRLFLSWLEQNPDVRIPSELGTCYNVYGCTKDEMIAGVKTLGKVNKHFTGDLVWVTGNPVEGIKLDFNSSRENVCERVVTGTKQVDRQVIPAVPEKVIEAHEVDIVEWRCSPLLEETEKVETATA